MPPQEVPIVSEDIELESGDVRLAATLYRPRLLTPVPALVVLHAANGGERSFPFYRHLSRFLPERGIAVLLYDRRGSGGSTGDFAAASFDELADDALAAVAWLTARPDIDAGRIGLYGISQGGWLAPLAASGSADVAFLVIVSGSGVSPARQMMYAAGYALREAGWSVDVASRALALRQRVDAYYRGAASRATVQVELDSAKGEAWYRTAFLPRDPLPTDRHSSKWYHEFDFDPLRAWAGVRVPTLFLFAGDDRYVPVEDSMAAFERATAGLEDVTMVRIEGTDHLMHDGVSGVGAESGFDVSERYFAALRRWLEPRLG